MLKKVLLFLLPIIIFGSLAGFAIAQEDSHKKVEVHFFYSATCPHCANEKAFLEELEKKYPEVEFKKYELLSSSENQEILKDFYEKYQVPNGEQGRVPVTFTPNEYFVGFNDQIGENIENCLKECLGGEGGLFQKVKIPFFGEVDLSKMSLPAVTITLGALDGLNPCAMWILLFLIAILINTKSRKRIWLIGGTFILASGIIYFLLLSAWLNLFLFISYVNWTRIIIGIFAVGFGVWQLKEFIYYQPGICKVLGLKPRLQQKFTEKAEKIITSPITFAMMGGLILLALAVNLIEFFCSAGLPAIFTRILTLSQLSSLGYYFYLLLYTFVFMLDDLIIFSLAIITLRKVGFTEKYNYWATLIGGILIFILGILLIFRPNWLMFGG